MNEPPTVGGASRVTPSNSNYPPTYSDELVEYLAARGVHPKVAIARGYRDVLAGKPNNKSSDDEKFASTYGFPAVRGGILMPLHPLLGGEAYQLRYYPADIKGKPRVQKIKSPTRQRNCLVTSPVIPPERLREKDTALVIAEGVTKVDALAGYDVPTVGIMGAWGWRGKNEVEGKTALPEFNELAVEGGAFIIGLDGDIKTKQDVALAAFTLKAYLLSRRAKAVHILALPNGEGIDDWIAREHFPDKQSLLEALKGYLLDDEQEADLAKSHSIPRGADFIPNTHAGLREGLRKLEIDVRKNLRTLNTEWRNGAKPPAGTPNWPILDDTASQHVLELLESNFFFSDVTGPNFAPRRFQLPRSRFMEKLDAILHENKVDPFKEWIEALDKWDGKPRLDTLFPEVLEVPDDPLARHAAKILIVAVRRCYKEWAYDHVPILVGAQGAAKTSFVRHLIPQGPDYTSWFVDAVELGGKEKELQEKAGGAVVVELSEMSSIGAANREHLKTLITQTSSTVRLAYRRNAERFERRYILIGTSNPSDYSILPFDNSGYRRFIPLYVSDTTTYKSVTQYFKEHREQLWAETLHRHKEGESTHLPKHLERETSQRASDLAQPDVVGSAVEDLTRKLLGTGAAKDNTTVYLMAEAGLVEKDKMASAPKSLRNEFMGKLQSEGWKYTTTRFRGIPAPKKVWCPPETLSDRLQAIEVVGGQEDPTIECCVLCSEAHPHPDKTANRLPNGKLRCCDTAKCTDRATTNAAKGDLCTT